MPKTCFCKCFWAVYILAGLGGVIVCHACGSLFVCFDGLYWESMATIPDSIAKHRRSLHNAIVWKASTVCAEISNIVMLAGYVMCFTLLRTRNGVVCEFS